MADPTKHPGPGGAGTTTDILYGDPDDSGLDGIYNFQFDDTPEVQDILDETTALKEDGLYYLSGDNLAANMSAIAPWCLSTEQMNIVAEADEDWGAGWIFNHLIAGAGINWATIGAQGGIVVTKLSVNSVYIDPDQDVTTAIDGLAQYGHTGLPDPTLPNAPGTGDSYGNSTHVGQVYVYNGADDGTGEHLALLEKFGYTAGIADYPVDAYGAAYVRIGMEIDDLIEMLQVGYSSRQNISRSTPGVNIFDNFEVISTVENEEPIDESTSGVATSTMITDTGDYDS